MQLLTASLDDLVFEGRNQAYGAYQLRRHYGQHLASAGGITLGVCALLLSAWFAWPAALPKPQVLHPVVVTPILPPMPAVVIEQPKLAPPPAVAQAAVPHTHHISAPKVVADNKVLPPQPIEETPTPEVLDGPLGPHTLGDADPLASGNSAAAGGTGTSEVTAPAPTEPYRYVEKMPEFAGGQAALLRYLQAHLRYPGQALHEGIEGRVFMSFVVRADGTIAEATVVKGLGYGLDEEALRVVRQMPAWTPGYQAQHAVPVRFTLPITFKLQ